MMSSGAKTSPSPAAFSDFSWEALSHALEQHPDLSPADYASWIAPLSAVSFDADAGKLTLAVPTRFIQDWVEENFEALIKSVAAEMTGQKITLTYDVQPMIQAAAPVTPAVQDVTEAGLIPPQSAPAVKEGSPLKENYTFEHFVTGKSNEMAYAIAERIASQPAAEFNPLVFFGGVGLGKTHLMHATAWAMQQKNPKAKILYLSAEQFLFRFIRSLQNKNTASFKKAFRDVDLLLIDDVQFIAGKGATQEEFFHTFNALVAENKQIILTSDRSPSALDKLEDRLKSRLSNGLTCQIHPPEYETRLAILRNKAAALELSLGDDILDYIATHIVSNVRELEGALNRLNAYAKFAGSAMTLSFAKEQLADMCAAAPAPKEATIEHIQQTVATYFNIRLADMLGKSRKANLVRPRQIAMYLAKHHTTHSYPEIGRQFNGRDHSTVMHAAQKVQDQLTTDTVLSSDISQINQILGK